MSGLISGAGITQRQYKYIMENIQCHLLNL
jgi:hypothetical protein